MLGRLVYRILHAMYSLFLTKHLVFEILTSLSACSNPEIASDKQE